MVYIYIVIINVCIVLRTFKTLFKKVVEKEIKLGPLNVLL